MVDIQSATAEIRRGKKERRKKKQDKNIMSASATQKRKKKEQERTRIWANAGRDGRPAEYRWRLLFNAAKFG